MSNATSLELLTRFVTGVTGAVTMNELLNIVKDDVCRAFRCSSFMFFIEADDDTGNYSLLYSDDADTVTERRQPVVCGAQDELYCRAGRSAGPHIISTDAWLADEKCPHHIRQRVIKGVKEILSVRIAYGSKHYGTVCLCAGAHGTFTTEMVSLAKSLGELLGGSIANIMAIKKIAQQAKEMDCYKQQSGESDRRLPPSDTGTHLSGHIIGVSREMQTVFRLINTVAAADSTVLLLGETGTGKELVADALHRSSSRRNKTMVKVNCAAIPANLIESELFGHEKGSFTGAAEKRIGKFELANNGTLFLDEIGELPLGLQVKLLRALQAREIERIGGKGPLKINVRIIAATSRNLEAEVEQGRFRSDLYYRLNVFPIHLPALRERKADIPALADCFVKRYAGTNGKNIQSVSGKVLRKLNNYPWPGNVRELEHIIERSVLLATGPVISDVQLPHQQRTLHKKAKRIRPLEDVEREYILEALQLCNGRVSGPAGAAVHLKLPSTTLISKMQKLGIRKEHFIKNNKPA